MCTAIWAKTLVKGTVVDDTGLPMPSVNISFQGTVAGIITNIDGKYSLETDKPSDTLLASFIGFKEVRKSVSIVAVQTIDFELLPQFQELDDVVITANRKDKNPDVTFMKKVVAAKSKNDVYAQNYVQYEVYGKVELDLNNLDEEFQDRKVMQRFGFMFESENQGDITAKPYVHVILAENLSEYFYRKFPKEQKEVILTSRISGVKNESVHEQLTNTYLKVNLYDDFVDVFTKGFVSPLSATGGHEILSRINEYGGTRLFAKIYHRRRFYP